MIQDLTVAPDGSSVVYGRRTIENGKYRKTLWRTTFRGGRPDRLTAADGMDARPRFSPDGASLLFLSDRSGRSQPWVLPLSGGEPRLLADVPGDVSAAEWSPDGGTVLLLAPSGEERFVVGDVESPTARRIADYTWRIDGGGYRDQWTSLWTVAGRRRTPAASHRPPVRGRGCVLAPGGPAHRPDRRHRAGRAGRVPTGVVDPGARREAASGGGHRGDGLRGVLGTVGRARVHRQRPRQGPGVGKRRALRSRGRRRAPTRRRPRHVDRVHQLRRHGRSRRRLPGDAGVARRADPGRVRVAPRRHPALCVRPGRGRPAARRRRRRRGHLPGDGRRTDRRGRIRRRPGRGLRRRGRGPASVDSRRQPVVRALPAFARADLRSRTPTDTRSTGGSCGPAARDAEGPPCWWCTAARTPRSHPSRGWRCSRSSDAGLHVLWCNPRGSTSYGEKYAQFVDGAWGDPDSDDLLLVVDWAVRAGSGRPPRIGHHGPLVRGLHDQLDAGPPPRRFRGSGQREPGDRPDRRVRRTADFGVPIGRAAVRRGASVGTSAGVPPPARPTPRSIATSRPLLLLQAEQDQRCPPAQSELPFAILRSLGRTVEMVRYPDESHIMLIIGTARSARRSPRAHRGLVLAPPGDRDPASRRRRAGLSRRGSKG